MSSRLALGTHATLPQRSAARPNAGVVQRRCACGGTPGPDGECATCRAKRLGLQRRSAIQDPASTVPPIVHEVLRSPGQPLDAATRAFMEPRFGHDFSRVHVHTDARADESARTVNAAAYAVGHDIVFGAGRYAPASMEGRRLLAHELTHVVQQGAGDQNRHRDLEIADARGNGAEREAEMVSETITRDRPHHVKPARAKWVARQRPDGGKGNPPETASEAPAREWGGFRISGDADFVRTVRGDLDQINRTTTGRSLLAEMQEYTRPFYRSLITIDPLSACGYINERIRYNAGGCHVPNNCQGGDPAWTSVPNYVYLYHEIVHTHLDLIAGKGTHPDRECMTTGLGPYFASSPYNENRLRCELGLPVRPCYDGECRLQPPTCGAPREKAK